MVLVVQEDLENIKLLADHSSSRLHLTKYATCRIIKVTAEGTSKHEVYRHCNIHQDTESKKTCSIYYGYAFLFHIVTILSTSLYLSTKARICMHIRALIIIVMHIMIIDLLPIRPEMTSEELAFLSVYSRTTQAWETRSNTIKLVVIAECRATAMGSAMLHLTPLQLLWKIVSTIASMTACTLIHYNSHSELCHMGKYRFTKLGYE